MRPALGRRCCLPSCALAGARLQASRPREGHGALRFVTLSGAEEPGRIRLTAGWGTGPDQARRRLGTGADQARCRPENRAGSGSRHLRTGLIEARRSLWGGGRSGRGVSPPACAPIAPCSLRHLGLRSWLASRHPKLASAPASPAPAAPTPAAIPASLLTSFLHVVKCHIASRGRPARHGKDRAQVCLERIAVEAPCEIGGQVDVMRYVTQGGGRVRRHKWRRSWRQGDKA